MDRTKIQEAVELLDREVPREGARVKFDVYGGDHAESMIVANEPGFLRLGIEFLKAGLASTGDQGPAHKKVLALAQARENGASVDVDLGYLTVPNSSIRFDWFEKRDPAEPEPLGSAAQHIMGVVLLVFYAAVACLALVGLATVMRWIRR